MSEENVEIIRRAWEQWQRGGETPDAIPVELYADDVEWDISGYPTVDLPSRGSWTSYQGEVTEFIDAGENVVGVLHEKTRIGDSGDFVERDLFLVWTLRDGLVVKYRAFETREQALQAIVRS